MRVIFAMLFIDVSDNGNGFDDNAISYYEAN